MNRHCVIMLGALPGADDEAAVWARAAAAFKLDEQTFASRIRAVLPAAIRHDLDEAAAERTVAQLQALQVDACAQPDDRQLAYLQRNGRICGPLPQSSLAQFAGDGDRYRLRGEHEWQVWSAPAEADDDVAPGAASSEWPALDAGLAEAAVSGEDVPGGPACSADTAVAVDGDAAAVTGFTDDADDGRTAAEDIAADTPAGSGVGASHDDRSAGNTAAGAGAVDDDDTLVEIEEDTAAVADEAEAEHGADATDVVDDDEADVAITGNAAATDAIDDDEAAVLAADTDEAADSGPQEPVEAPAIDAINAPAGEPFTPADGALSDSDAPATLSTTPSATAATAEAYRTSIAVNGDDADPEGGHAAPDASTSGPAQLRTAASRDADAAAADASVADFLYAHSAGADSGAESVIEATDAPTPPAPPAPGTTTATSLWIGERDQVFGPYTAQQVRHWLLSEELDPAAMACPVGTTSWVTLHSLFPEEAPLVTPPPPGPPAMPMTMAGSRPAPERGTAPDAEPADDRIGAPAASMTAIEQPSDEASDAAAAAAPTITAATAAPATAAAPADAMAGGLIEDLATAPPTAPVAPGNAAVAAAAAGAVSPTMPATPARKAKAKGARWSWFGDSPLPPSLHWSVLLLLSIVTAGAFALLWSSDQARWVRRVDSRNKASAWMTLAAACWIVGIAALVIHRLWLPDPRLLLAAAGLGGLFELTWLAGCFAMASAIRQHVADKAITVVIDPVTLFVFNIFYLQGQFTRLARWQKTGQASRKAPRAVFWWLLFVVGLLGLAVLAAVTVAGSYHFR